MLSFSSLILRAHQSVILGSGIVLADQMGMGKTLSMIRVIDFTLEPHVQPSAWIVCLMKTTMNEIKSKKQWQKHTIEQQDGDDDQSGSSAKQLLTKTLQSTH